VARYFNLTSIPKFHWEFEALRTALVRQEPPRVFLYAFDVVVLVVGNLRRERWETRRRL